MYCERQCFPPKIGNKARLSTLIPPVIIQYSRPEKEVKGLEIRKEKLKLFLFANNICLCVEYSKVATKHLFELVSEFDKVVEYEVYTEKFITFLYTSNVQLETKSKNMV